MVTETTRGTTSVPNETDAARLPERLQADRRTWPAVECPAARALDVVGTKSAFLILREAFYGTRRFDDFARRVGITDAVVSARLRELTEHGLFERVPYREPGQRTRYEYHLTQMGRDFRPALMSLLLWGGTYLFGDEGSPLQIEHAGCGSPVEVAVRCAAGHDVPLGETLIRPTRPKSRSAR